MMEKIAFSKVISYFVVLVIIIWEVIHYLKNPRGQWLSSHVEITTFKPLNRFNDLI